MCVICCLHWSIYILCLPVKCVIVKQKVVCTENYDFPSRYAKAVAAEGVKLILMKYGGRWGLPDTGGNQFVHAIILTGLTLFNEYTCANMQTQH